MPLLEAIYPHCMSSTADKLEQEIKSLADAEKLRLVDRIWAEEARKRWAAYQAGRVRSVSYEDVTASTATDESPISRELVELVRATVENREPCLA